MLKLMTACAVISAISGCAHNPKLKAVPDASCAAFQVIHPSRQDTTDTKRQVLAHNTVYRKLCGAKQ